MSSWYKFIIQFSLEIDNLIKKSLNNVMTNIINLKLSLLNIEDSEYIEIQLKHIQECTLDLLNKAQSNLIQPVEFGILYTPNGYPIPNFHDEDTNLIFEEILIDKENNFFNQIDDLFHENNCENPFIDYLEMLSEFKKIFSPYLNRVEKKFFDKEIEFLKYEFLVCVLNYKNFINDSIDEESKILGE